MVGNLFSTAAHLQGQKNFAAHQIFFNRKIIVASGVVRVKVPMQNVKQVEINLIVASKFLEIFFQI